ncbi:hypothetical protein HDU93_001164, partial [Gonapodya sp. JEL0774]
KHVPPATLKFPLLNACAEKHVKGLAVGDPGGPKVAVPDLWPNPTKPPEVNTVPRKAFPPG